MSDFLNRAMKNVTVEEKPKATLAPQHSHTIQFDFDKMISDFDLQQLASPEFKEQVFLAISAIFLNLAQGQTDEKARTKVRAKVARVAKGVLNDLANDTTLSLRKLDPELEQELANHLSNDNNPL